MYKTCEQTLHQRKYTGGRKVPEKKNPQIICDQRNTN